MKNVSAIAVLLMVLTGSVHAQNFEYANAYQSYLSQINLTPSLHSSLKPFITRSRSALNVGIAILDGRADPTHIDLRGRLTISTVYRGRYRTYDSHATHVVGLAGASLNGLGFVGVDPFAKLYSIPVFDDFGWVATDNGKAALDRARTLGAKVVNMSFGPSTAGDVFFDGELNLLTTYRNSMLLVRAVGNDGLSSADESFSGNAASTLAHLLIVGSVGSNNQISSFSNTPSTACFVNVSGCVSGNELKNFYLVAPGENIWSDLPGNMIGSSDGTSMASALVSGAGALVFQKAYAGNTLLTPSQVASILKISATDLGEAGVDGTYGWGLLNVGGALSPIGPLRIATTNIVSTSTQTLTSARMVRASTMAKNSDIGSLTNGMVMFDDYGRGFTLSSTDMASPRSTLVSDALSMLNVSLKKSEDKTSQILPRLQYFQSESQNANYGGVFFANDIYAISSGFGNANAYFTGLGQNESDAILSQRLGANFFTGSGDIGLLFGNSYFASADMDVTDRLSVGVVYSRSSAQETGSFIDVFSVSSMPTEQKKNDVMMLGGSYNISGKQRVDFSIGSMTESQSFLGIESSGAFSFGNATRTDLLGLGYAHKFGERFGFNAFVQTGYSQSEHANNSIFTISDDIWSSKAGFTMYGSDILRPEDRLQMSIVSPWQIKSGHIDAQIAIGRQFDGTVDYEARRVSLASDALPIDLGFAYTGQSGAMNYGVGLWFRDHDISQASIDETVTTAGIKLQF